MLHFANKLFKLSLPFLSLPIKLQSEENCIHCTFFFATLNLHLHHYMSMNHFSCQHHCPHLIVYHHHYPSPDVELFDSLKEYLQAAEGLGQSTNEWTGSHWHLFFAHVLLDLEDQVAQCYHFIRVW